MAEREVVTRVRDSTFLAATAFTLALLVVGFVVIALIDGHGTTYEVAVTSPGRPPRPGSARRCCRPPTRTAAPT